MSELPTTGWARLVFVDVFGGAHAVLLPAARLAAALTDGVAFDGSALEGRNRYLETDMLLLPDPATAVPVAVDEVRLACTVMTADGVAWEGDPRTALGRIVDDTAEMVAGYRVAAELEYYLLDADGRPVDTGAYFADLHGAGMAITTGAADTLGSLGVDVVGAHVEAGDGQYEVDLGAMAPVALADALVLAKSVLRQTAAAHGARATFMARPLPGQPGSGLHLHQHLPDDGRSADDGRAVIGGQLAHAAGLCALAAPNVNSYKRLHAGPEAPGPVVWAHRNRNAVIRVAASAERHPSIEFRVADPAANPYLLLGGLLAAASDGLARGLDSGPVSDEDPGGYDPATSAKRPIQLLPRVLDAALDALLADDVLVDAFDAGLIQRMVDGRRAESRAYRAQVTPWELERYLDEA